MDRTGLKRLACLGAFALIGGALAGCEPIAEQADDAELAQELKALQHEKDQLQSQMAQLNRDKQALERVTELEHAIVSAKPGSPLRKQLEQQHRQSKQDGYQREFHEAIQKHGGERLKHEWQSYCRSKPSADDRELNCN